MASDLIRKSDVMKTIYWYRDNQPSETTYNTVTDMADDIHNLPTADLVEVVHGEWIGVGKNFYSLIVECSECGAKYDFTPPHCPNCGTKMDGKKVE